MPTRAPEISELTEMVLPAQGNHYGTLFAGHALSLLTKAAFTAASRHAQAKVVLASVHEMRFRAPVPVGNLFVMQAQVVEAGRSSMTVAVTGQREDPETGTRQQVAQGQFQMVAVNVDGRPTKITPRESLS